MPKVSIGLMELSVQAGAAEAQKVKTSAHWSKALQRSSSTTPGLADDRTSMLVAALDAATDGDRILRRSALYEAAETGPLDEALLIVMAWGLGSSGRWNLMTRCVRQALHDQAFKTLGHSRASVNNGTDLEGLWDTHFGNRPPPGLGSVAFGSKWLHAVGYRHTEGPKPLVYDVNVWCGLSSCAGLPGYRKPVGPRSLLRESWLKWCRLAHKKAEDSEASISASDIEVSLFSHAKRCVGGARCDGRSS